MKSVKITDRPPRTSGRGRWYEDACAAAHGLDLLGERWSLLVMREMLLGPRRFSELRHALPGISANVLTQRLEGLEAAGIVARRRLPPPASAQLYELTPWGAESGPILTAMGRWAVRSPFHDPTMPISNTSLMLSLLAMFDAGRAEGMAARIGLVLAGEEHLATIEAGSIRVARARPEGAGAVLDAAPAILGAALYAGQPLAALEAGGLLRVGGDRALAERFVTLFPMPEKAPRP